MFIVVFFRICSTSAIAADLSDPNHPGPLSGKHPRPWVVTMRSLAIPLKFEKGEKPPDIGDVLGGHIASLKVGQDSGCFGSRANIWGRRPKC